jgi:hypothetical protein
MLNLEIVKLLMFIEKWYNNRAVSSTDILMDLRTNLEKMKCANPSDEEINKCLRFIKKWNAEIYSLNSFDVLIDLIDILEKMIYVTSKIIIFHILNRFSVYRYKHKYYKKIIKLLSFLYVLDAGEISGRLTMRAETLKDENVYHVYLETDYNVSGKGKSDLCSNDCIAIIDDFINTVLKNDIDFDSLQREGDELSRRF